MIRDDELRSSLDYSEGQKEAAHRVLVELVNLFNEYRDDIRIVGGWVPDLMFPGEGHVGSIDVDVLINHIKLKDNGYLTMAKILLRNGYKEHPEKYFSFVKQVQVDGISYDVDVDILAGTYGGTQKKKRSQRILGKCLSFLREAMSHAQTGRLRTCTGEYGDGCLQPYPG